jgi:hypothetical protein
MSTKCPQCGYVERPAVLRNTNIMNHYVQKDNPKNVAVMQSNDESITTTDKAGKTTVFVRKDLFKATALVVQQVIAAPIPATQPVKPVETVKPIVSTPVTTAASPAK